MLPNLQYFRIIAIEVVLLACVVVFGFTGRSSIPSIELVVEVRLVRVVYQSVAVFLCTYVCCDLLNLYVRV